ncbi:hypothetical protein HPB52_003091 [Rhipicephalus sanguineus]|uniref:Uncharacterized protein n=1 Tax=Rhipicephalus sanguineus TaxID=34632 RepID=A0A9D4PQK7_RHISA|nr:hypothetical protein HPB52_003091 [Rhipicephalus sanguineus]
MPVVTPVHRASRRIRREAPEFGLLPDTMAAPTIPTDTNQTVSSRPTSSASSSDHDFCVSSRKFAIGIAIAGVLLMLAVMLLVACILHRRRRRKGSSTAGSSIYSGPYSNHGYSRE